MPSEKAIKESRYILHMVGMSTPAEEYVYLDKIAELIDTHTAEALAEQATFYQK